MGRKILATTVLLLAWMGLSAQQTGTVTATVTDAATKEAVVGAVVELALVKDSLAQKKYTTSAAKGVVSMPGIAYGEYRMTVTFLGYAPWVKQITVSGSRTNAGAIALEQEAKRIDDIVLEVQAMRTSQKGDTVVYNADAFKVSKDADAEGLLAKMPGLTVVNGEVEAQGEQVKKVFVDGKEFFGGDVATAIKNLPAEAVSKVEVYNKLSDQAQFTGVDDGEGYKAINIVTNPSMRNSAFGKLNAGYGFNDLYNAGGNINFFKGKRRFSIIGMGNNINQQNFSTEDILSVTGGSGGGGMRSRGGGQVRMQRGGGGSGRDFMVGQQPGISKVGAIGFNYTDSWSPKIDFEGSYFFNTSRNENQQLVDRQYFSETPTVQVYDEASSTWSRNTNHRLNAKLDYKISEIQTLMLRPSISFQRYSSDNNELSHTGQYTEPANDLITGLYDIISGGNSISNGYNISTGVVYRLRLGKPGRTITFEGTGRISKNDSDRQSLSFTDYNDGTSSWPDITDNRLTAARSSGYRVDGNLIYTEPLTEKSQVVMQYRLGYNYSDADNQTLRSDGVLPYLPAPDYSNVSNSGYLTQRVGPGYRYGSDKAVIVANVFYQKATLSLDQTLPSVLDKRASFDNIVYFGMVNFNFSQSTSLRLFTRSSTDNPSISQLQRVAQGSNIQNVSTGNPNLKQSYANDVMMFFTRSSVTKGRTLMVMLGGSLRSDYIADSTVYLGAAGAVIDGYTVGANGQFTKPVNMDGYRNFRSRISYGTPVKFIKSNINFNMGYDMSRSPSIIDGVANFSTGNYFSGGAVLGSNISEKIDFTFTYNGGYNLVKNSFNTKNDNTYFSQAATGRFKWDIGSFTLRGDASYSQYKGISQDYNEHYVICNAQIGKKIFKNKRGEINIGVYDIFDQNKSFSRNVTSRYIENVTNVVLGRYVGINLIYNLRKSGAGQGGERSGGTSQGPFGPPPGGGRQVIIFDGPGPRF